MKLFFFHSTIFFHENNVWISSQYWIGMKIWWQIQSFPLLKIFTIQSSSRLTSKSSSLQLLSITNALRIFNQIEKTTIFTHLRKYKKKKKTQNKRIIFTPYMLYYLHEFSTLEKAMTWIFSGIKHRLYLLTKLNVTMNQLCNRVCNILYNEKQLIGKKIIQMFSIIFMLQWVILSLFCSFRSKNYENTCFIFMYSDENPLRGILDA